MKKINYLWLAGLALAGCSSEDYLGNEVLQSMSKNGEISFLMKKVGVTRADKVGADAAAILNNQFVVAGFKGGDGTVTSPAAASVTTDKVFDHYYVNFAANTAGTTESNTADWEYVGQQKDGTTGGVHAYASTNGITEQTIKYWDYSKAQYDFIAYSVNKDVAVYDAKAAGKLYITEVTPSSATNPSGGAYTVAGATNELKDFYIADLVTVTKGDYNKEVQLKFRNISSKVRVGLYETVPGYSVKDVEFYASDAADLRYVKETSVNKKTVLTSEYYESDGTTNSYHEGDEYDSSTTYYDNSGHEVQASNVAKKDVLTKQYYNSDGTTTYAVGSEYNSSTVYYNPESDVTTTATLYSQAANIYTDGTYTVYYPTVNTNSGTTGHPASDLNKAHVSFEPTKDASEKVTGATTTSTYATLNYTNSKSITGSAVNYLGETSNTATYCTTSPEKDYFAVLPNETATALTLRVNYTLVSNDGSKETIKIWGAKAVVPAQYTAWKSNYAYTYLFKISDNTNGSTEELNGTEGLYPITFDAVVTQAEDGMQETVTTVATPSITTYMKDAPNVTAKEEYPAGTIYVMVQDGATIKDLSSDGQLYEVTGASLPKVPATEANVMDALNMGTTVSSVTTGRNGLVLTEATSDATITAIPGVNGNNITVSAGQAASFTATAGKTYAYVYTVSTGTATYYGSAITPAADADVTSYYTDPDCTVSATGTADGSTVYYQKLTNNNNVYAVKVIKIKS